MEVLYLIIPLSIVLIVGIGWVFMWSVRSGQFDDLEGPAHRLIMEDDEIRDTETDIEKAKNHSFDNIR